jgi:hypothetical protein
MVLIFKTDVTSKKQANAILTQLSATFPTAAINFDLEDCDRILRIAGSQLSAHTILAITKTLGIVCEELEE